MKLNGKTIHRLMKLSFSAVILQLLYISLCIGAKDSAAIFLPVFYVPEMLTVCAASTALTVAGGFVLSFSDRFFER